MGRDIASAMPLRQGGATNLFARHHLDIHVRFTAALYESASRHLSPQMKNEHTTMNKLIDSLLLEMRRRSQRAHLESLDDRLLADMGLTRDDIRGKGRQNRNAF